MYRIDQLLKQNQKLFHTQDLALLWEIENNNTLYTTIKRYVQKGILIPIHKGFYSTLPLSNINLFLLGIGYLHSFSYVSTETVLSNEGIVFQKTNYITLISNTSKKFKIGDIWYHARKLKERYLYNESGIETKDNVRIATVERAVSDLIYFDPLYHFDLNTHINWKKVKKIQKEVGYQ